MDGSGWPTAELYPDRLQHHVALKVHRHQGGAARRALVWGDSGDARLRTGNGGKGEAQD